MKKSKKASSRVTAPNQEASAADAEAKTASRRKAVRANAVENVARRQFQKTQATVSQGVIRGHAGSDSRRTGTRAKKATREAQQLRRSVASMRSPTFMLWSVSGDAWNS